MKQTILLSIAAAIAAALVVGQVGASGPAQGNVSLSVFKRPQTAADRLPASITSSHMATHFANANSRLLGHYAGASWYTVPGVDRTICLLGTDGELSWGSCTDAATLVRRVIYNGRENAQHQVDVAVLATDGLTRVTYPGGSKRIRQNAFFVTLPKDDLTLQASGPGMPTHVVALPFAEK